MLQKYSEMDSVICRGSLVVAADWSEIVLEHFTSHLNRIVYYICFWAQNLLVIVSVFKQKSSKIKSLKIQALTSKSLSFPISKVIKNYPSFWTGVEC